MLPGKRGRKAVSSVHIASSRVVWLIVAFDVTTLGLASSTRADDDAIIMTPPGFGRPGLARMASGSECGGFGSRFETAQPIS